MGNIKLVEDVMVAEKDWRVLYGMIDLLEKEVLSQMGNFDDQNFTSLEVVRELINSAKHICEKQWRGLNILVKLQSTGVIKLQ